LQKVAPLWPSYHLDRLALAAVGLRQPALAMHALVLLGLAILFLGLAVRRLRRHG
jgi:ABC-2 type transport system permease protein